MAGEAANCFAKFFHEKVAANVAKSNVVINDVYNGKCKLIVQNRNFMNITSVKECMSTLNQKKCEGYCFFFFFSFDVSFCYISFSILILL